MNSIVIVLYHPDWSHLYTILKNLSGNNIILVDNTPSVLMSPYLQENIANFSDIIYVALNQNMGIAYAQNIGVRIARCIEKTKNVIFFDQDSDIGQDYIHKITCEFVKLKKIIPKLATLGPVVTEKRSGDNYKIKGQQVLDTACVVDNIISSGSIVPLELFDDDLIGPYREDLFIDLVDSEWCWRANYKGYKCAITSNVILPHQVGDSYIKLPGISFIISKPIRNYYQVRNSLIIAGLKHVNIYQKVNLLVHQLIYFCVVPFLKIKNKREILKNMLRGCRDAFIRRTELNIDSLPFIYIYSSSVDADSLLGEFGKKAVINTVVL